MNANRKHIQNTLRKHRMLSGYKQAEVAALLGHSNASRLSQWENGDCMPSGDNLFNLSIL
ncbi:MAG: helix-turn-helix transcriptional regulator [Candidatus Paceibacterota bacterium]